MTKYQDLDHQSDTCIAVRSVLAKVGDKWSVLIIVMLGEGCMRFNQIKTNINGISQRMLTLTLRTLERDGLLLRTVYPTVPPKVEYELTALGHSLRQAIIPLSLWAQDNVEQILQAREHYDSPASE